MLAKEAKRIAELKTALVASRSALDGAAGQALVAAVRGVGLEFSDTVARSEIGLLDIAWARKETRTRRVSTLIRARQAELRMLEEMTTTLDLGAGGQ